MAKAAKTKEFVSKQGNKYMFQKARPGVWLEMMDTAHEGGQLSRVALYQGVLDTVVVTPSGLKMDDFEEEGRGGYAELEEVTKAAITFQQGK